MYLFRLLALLCLLFPNLSLFAQEEVNTIEEIQMPAANWDFVPNQVFNKPINIGLLAFHSSGIKRVDFFLNEKFYNSVTEAKFNPDSKVKEYFINIDPTSLAEGFSTIKATIYAFDGKKRDLVPMSIFFIKSESLTNEFYVSNNGSDESGNGSEDKPYKTISEALKKIPVGSQLVLNEPGTYYLTGQVRKNITDKWTTIRGNSSYKRNQFILSMPIREKVRLMMDKIKFQNLTLDFAGIATIFPENDQSVWFDNVLWTDSNFNENPPKGEPPLSYPKKFDAIRTSGAISGYYVTNSEVKRTYGGFIGAKIARNVVIDQVLGDALTNARLVANAEVKNILGNETQIHSDIFQYYGSNIDNVIVYNVIGRNIGGTAYRAKYKKIVDNGVQNFFIGDSKTTISNSAFVNACIENKQSRASAPFSQLNSVQKNVLYQNITTINQKWVFRTDLPGSKRFSAKNVVFKQCNIPNMISVDNVSSSNLTEGFDEVQTKKKYVKTLPDGVTIENSNTNFSPLEINGLCDNKIKLSE